MNCSICKRELDTDDSLSQNLGGDCAYCMLDAELKVEDFESAFSICVDILKSIALLIARNQR